MVVTVLSKEDILNSRKCVAMDYHGTDNIYGGDFVGKLKSFGRKALAGIKTALPYVKDVASVIGTVAPFLPLLGLGEDEGGVMVGGDSGGVMLGGRRKMSKGGRVISRRELHERLQ